MPKLDRLNADIAREEAAIKRTDETFGRPTESQLAYRARLVRERDALLTEQPTPQGASVTES